MTRRDLSVTEGAAAEPNGTPRLADHGAGRFEHLFERLPQPAADIRIVDDEPIIEAVNARFEARFDVRGEPDGEPLADYIQPASATEEAERIGHRISAGDHTEEVVERAASATTERLRCEIIPYGRSDDRAFLIYSDVTEAGQKRAELESRNQELEELASILSHDLRNPVNAARGWLKEIDSEAEPVARVEKSLERIETMIDKTLTLTQKPEIIENTEMVEVNELAQACWQQVDTADADLVVDDDFNLLCDSDQLSRLLENLFRNAVDHNTDAITIRIGIHDRMATTTRGSEKPTDAFYIADDGAGIPRENREAVVEYGETTAKDGTGLGLSIVHRIADAHGWEMDIKETVNGGAKFVFSDATLHGRIPRDSE